MWLPSVADRRASIHRAADSSSATGGHDRLRAALAARRGGDPVPAATGPQAVRLPLPTASFLTFRAACRRLLEPADFEHVDRTFSMALEGSLGWLDQHHTALIAVRRLELELFGIRTRSS